MFARRVGLDEVKGMSQQLVLKFDPLLAPLPGDSPAGQWMQYTPKCNELREARREAQRPKLDANGLPLPNWTPNWKLVANRASDLLLKETKDLEIAVWLTEAITGLRGFAGLHDGLRLLRELQERFWDVLYPEIEDGDLEPRVGALSALEHPRFAGMLFSQPLTEAYEGAGPYSWYDWKSSRETSISSTDSTGSGESHSNVSAVAPERFDEVASRTSPSFYEDLGVVLDACWDEYLRLTAFVEQRYKKEDGLSLKSIKEVLKEYRAFVDRRRTPPDTLNEAATDELSDAVFMSFGEVEPITTVAAPSEADDEDPPNISPSEAEAHDEAAASAFESEQTSMLQPRQQAQATYTDGPSADIELQNRSIQSPTQGTWLVRDHVVENRRPSAADLTLRFEDSVTNDIASHLARLAERIRLEAPANPLPYLLTRAMRWGELRSAPREEAELLLIPPSTETRRELRALFMHARWNELLEASESAMGREEGRGWLDIQFYTSSALRGLGTSFSTVASLLRSDLRLLLQEQQWLISAELMDGTLAANARTREWLDLEVLSGIRTTEPRAPLNEPGRGESERAAHERPKSAELLLKEGRFIDGLLLLQQGVDIASSGRERFLRQLEIAEYCLLAQQPALALPLLSQLSEQAEQRRLLEWEDSKTCARIWKALLHCQSLPADPELRDSDGQRMFEQLCRADVIRASILTRELSNGRQDPK